MENKSDYQKIMNGISKDLKTVENQNKTLKIFLYLQAVYQFRIDTLKYFNIDTMEHPEILCSITSLLTFYPTISIVKLMEILNERHKNHDDGTGKVIPLSELIIKEYGEEAHKWFERHL